ncbi:hypothetical protein [Chthonobacter albigriseus]|uniref:hypothetical protein n=1 Tax=Chthonobacter albigriseus TaxID=1683161 RepID=UPI0015EF55D1|nr:hypothetical protein [Chthonobacter albigriseus]
MEPLIRTLSLVGCVVVAALQAPLIARAEEKPLSVPTQRVMPPGSALDRTGPPTFTVPNEGSPFTVEPEDNPDQSEDVGQEPSDPDAPLPEIHYGEADLPPAVARMRGLIVDAAKTGDVKALADLIAAAPVPPVLTSIDGGEPADILIAQSSDPEGREILAILLDVLDAGWVRVGSGSDERFVWPYFAQIPPDRLSAPQMVELFRIITAVDFEEMRAAGAYVFYRVEIGADGAWKLFQAGE